MMDQPKSCFPVFTATPGLAGSSVRWLEAGQWRALAAETVCSSPEPADNSSVIPVKSAEGIIRGKLAPLSEWASGAWNYIRGPTHQKALYIRTHSVLTSKNPSWGTWRRGCPRSSPISLQPFMARTRRMAVLLQLPAAAARAWRSTLRRVSPLRAAAARQPTTGDDGTALGLQYFPAPRHFFRSEDSVGKSSTSTSLGDGAGLMQSIWKLKLNTSCEHNNCDFMCVCVCGCACECGCGVSVRVRVCVRVRVRVRVARGRCIPSDISNIALVFVTV